MTDVFDDLAVQMAEQPGPKAETVDVIRGRLLAAMREAADDRPTRARGGTAHGRVSAVPERARFALSVAVIVVLAVAVFVVPLPQLFHFGPGARANKLVPAGKVANGPGGVSVARMLAGHWSQMPPAPVAQRAQDVVVWTGKELIVWGDHRAGQRLALRERGRLRSRHKQLEDAAERTLVAPGRRQRCLDRVRARHLRRLREIGERQVLPGDEPGGRLRPLHRPLADAGERPAGAQVLSHHALDG